MKLLIRLAAKIYPKSWRERYGEEFEALLEDAGVNVRIVFDVLAGAVLMQVQRWQKAGTAAALALIALSAVSRWVGQRPYLTPGTHQVFRMDSTLGFFLELLVVLSTVIVGLITMLAGRRRWIAPCIAVAYVGAVVLVSVFTPKTIVNIGDSYCWDLWCVGIRSVNTTPQDQNTLYTAQVSLFVDSPTAELELRDPGKGQAKQFFYAVDEQGRRFPILAYAPLADATVTVKPGESVKSSLTFLAPANARNLYLTGDIEAPPWVRLYFGSDLNPFHRRTLLRVV